MQGHAGSPLADAEPAHKVNGNDAVNARQVRYADDMVILGRPGKGPDLLRPSRCDGWTVADVAALARAIGPVVERARAAGVINRPGVR